MEPADDGVTVINTVDDQQGSSLLGDFTAKKRIAFVYVTCSGPGNIDLVVKPLGTYQLNCDQTGPGSLNQFEVGVGASYAVTINGRDGQTWAATIAESDTGN
ncbi:hypothetical protein [Curtobacterium sp. USHLN213]|uniref:hypothetical protein n=1 Tax=Curtobacterium sp. USHLN213 TaxID=3081255 RepID=UPI003015F45D